LKVLGCLQQWRGKEIWDLNSFLISTAFMLILIAKNSKHELRMNLNKFLCVTMCAK